MVLALVCLAVIALVATSNVGVLPGLAGAGANIAATTLPGTAAAASNFAGFTGGGAAGGAAGEQFDINRLLSILQSATAGGGSVDQGGVLAQRPPSEGIGGLDTSLLTQLAGSGLPGASPELGGFADDAERQKFIGAMVRTSVAVSVIDLVSSKLRDELDFLREKAAIRAAKPEEDSGLGGGLLGGGLGALIGGILAAPITGGLSIAGGAVLGGAGGAGSPQAGRGAVGDLSRREQAIANLASPVARASPGGSL